MAKNSEIIENDYKVLVRCFTYNQSKYIEDALNGFKMQQTDFPFVCLVMDDASTDGEQDVIKAWMERECDMARAEMSEIDEANITIVPHKTNENCTFAFYFLKQNLYGTGKKTPLVTPWREKCEYEALCEGDDYWIHPEKLQKQIDKLDSDSNCSMCVSDASIIASNGNDLNWTRYPEDCIVPIKDIIIRGGLWLQTATFVYRLGLPQMPECGRRCHVGDYPLIIWCALNGKISYIAVKTASYRFQHPNGWTALSNRASLEDRIKGWSSEVDMLLGFDKYSRGEYHEYFLKRSIKYIYWNIMYCSGRDALSIKNSFFDIYNHFSRVQKFKVWLRVNNLNRLLVLFELLQKKLF